jgi:hypothetical protein
MIIISVDLVSRYEVKRTQTTIAGSIIGNDDNGCARPYPLILSLLVLMLGWG